MKRALEREHRIRRLRRESTIAWPIAAVAAIVGYAPAARMPPTFIRDAADLARVVQVGTTTEGLYLDFKKTIDGWNSPSGAPERVRKEAQKELCRDVTQFANRDGGCLLLGVEEQKRSDGVKVAKKYAAIVDADAMKGWIEAAIANYCVPTTFSRDPIIVPHSEGIAIAVNVGPHPHTVYVWDRDADTIEVVSRTSHGKKRLNPNELERHLMNGSRAARLTLEAVISQSGRNPNTNEIVLHNQVLPTGPFVGHPLLQRSFLGQIDEFSFQLRIPLPKSTGETTTALIHVPYAFLETAWLDAVGRVNVMITVDLTWDGDELRLFRTH